MNPFFYFPSSASRFVPRTKAKAEDVNARLDEVSYGFDLVLGEFNARDLVLATKAPLANPAFTGSATLDGKALATQEYANSLAFGTVYPFDPVADRGKVLRITAGGLAAMGDPDGPAVPLTVADTGITLSKRTTYHVDTSGGAFPVNLPAGMAADDWVNLYDKTGYCEFNNVTINSNGNGNFRDGDTVLIMDVAYDRVHVVKTTTGVSD